MWPHLQANCNALTDAVDAESERKEMEQLTGPSNAPKHARRTHLGAELEQSAEDAWLYGG